MLRRGVQSGFCQWRESYRLGELVRAVAARRLDMDLGLDDYSRR